MEKEGGVPFTCFGHPTLVDTEIEYKWQIRHEGRTQLQLHRWSRWSPGTGRILQAAKDACHGNVSRNLLEHRFGAKGNSDSPLYRVDDAVAIRELESQLRDFLLGGSPQPEDIGPRFDRFAEFLRAEKLGCKWPFLAYLLFLLRPQTFFPILPGRFDRLLEFYGLPPVLSGRVEWTKYLLVLQLADLLRDLLAAYGVANAVEVQSYMWVVSYLVARPGPLSAPTIDLAAELRARERRAAERERIGLAGEVYVYRTQVEKLRAAGRPDLATRVTFVSLDDPSAGFDIKSFKSDGEELHIEVKTTSRSTALDIGFWLTNLEHKRGGADPDWTVYRVCDIDNTPYCHELGNIVQSMPLGWSIGAGS